MRSKLLFLAITLATLFVWIYPQPEAQAFVDPVTIAILTPIAIQAAKTMAPYVIKGLSNMGKMSIKAGIEMLNIFRLPLGFFQCTLLAPFGRNFSSGLGNIGKGAIAPFKMAFYTVMIPVAAFGVGL